jgi:hypothetical protein
MPKRRRSKQLREETHKPQKLKWQNHKTFNTFPEANSERIALLKEHQDVKVRRTGEDGIKFTVKIGKPVKENKIKKQKIGEEKDNASE